ncbi:hypothetical protein [Bosea sp. LC85]|uniref:hypothetical protein n=1 Tax=Bosea sp. LC85 TaxID=1502851 RepID=UPI0006980462|nr:hypothetical protein [Bosea sp. LC85]
MNTLSIRPAKPEDIAYIAARMRLADVEEIVSASEMTPAQALTLGFNASLRPLVADNQEGKPVCMFGVAPMPEPLVGSVWLLGTDAVKDNRMSFLRLSKTMTTEFHRDFPVLMNCVDERNAVHIGWLRWLGYSFLRRHAQWGKERRPFLEFARLQHV